MPSFAARAALFGPMLATISARAAASVEADAAEVDRQVVLQAAQDDVEDAVQVLSLADRTGRPLQQIEPRELRLQLRLRLAALAALCPGCARASG